MEERFIALGEGGPNVLALRRLVPIRGGGDEPVVSGESNQRSLPSVALADQLPHIELPPPAHFRGTRVSQVGVVLPHYDLRRPLATLEMLHQLAQRFEHV